MLEQNLKTFKEISGLRKEHKDLEESVNETYAKYDRLIESLNSKLDNHSEEQKNFITENVNNVLNEALDKNVSKYEDLIAESERKFDAVMLEQNLKTFKENESIKKKQKDFEEEVRQYFEKNDEKYNKISEQINEILEKSDIKYDDFIEELNQKLNMQFDEQKEYFSIKDKDLDNKYEAFIRNINEILDKNNVKYNELVSNINKYNTSRVLNSNRVADSSNYHSNDRLVNYIENRFDEESAKTSKRIKKLEDNQIRNDKEIKRVNKKVSDVAIVSVSIFIIAVIVFLAYQLL